jgi:hypothetical protein
MIMEDPVPCVIDANDFLLAMLYVAGWFIFIDAGLPIWGFGIWLLLIVMLVGGGVLGVVRMALVKLDLGIAKFSA